MSRQEAERKTKETDIALAVDIREEGKIDISTGLPFFDHMLNAMAFHGRMSLTVKARGDVEVDPHHLVEDVGLVLGEALGRTLETAGPTARYGHAVIPMDDALSEVTIDAGGRPYLDYQAEYPATRAGDFDLALIREFLLAFSNRARINLHAACRYGLNGHHMAEALFKALGIALKQAFAPGGAVPRSTKGVPHEGTGN